MQVLRSGLLNAHCRATHECNATMCNESTQLSNTVKHSSLHNTNKVMLVKHRSVMIIVLVT